MVALILWSHSIDYEFLYLLPPAIKIHLSQIGVALSAGKALWGHNEDGYCQRHDVHQKIYRAHRTYPPGLGFLFDHLFKPAERAAAAFVPEVTVAELVPTAWIHDELVDNERSKPFVQLEDTEIEVYHIPDTFHKVDRLVQRRIKILQHMLDLRRKDVPEEFLLCPEVIMYQGLIAAHSLGNLCRRRAVETFFKEKALCDPKYSLLDILVSFHSPYSQSCKYSIFGCDCLYLLSK